jgi:hypothetical protein
MSKVEIECMRMTGGRVILKEVRGGGRERERERERVGER